MALSRCSLAIVAGVATAALCFGAPSARAQVQAGAAPALRAEIAFEPGSATLDAGAAQTLDALASALRDRRGKWVVVVAPSLLMAEEGTRDDPEVVVDQERRELEDERREQVVAYLVELGVPRRQIVTVNRAADLDPSIERVMLYLEDATVADGGEVELEVREQDAAGQQEKEMSFRPVLPGERRERPEATTRADGEFTRPFYGAGEYVSLPRVSSLPPAGSGFLERVGVGVSVGGGLGGFVDPDTRGFAQAGGTWDARVTLGTRMPVAVEASYFGSANDLDALGLDDGAVLLGNGFESDIRVELLPTLPVRPYVVGGFGWTHFQVANASVGTSNLRESDGVLHAPLGAGVTVQRGRVLVDLRGLVRAAFDDTMLAQASEDSARLSTWGIIAKVGLEL